MGWHEVCRSLDVHLHLCRRVREAMFLETLVFAYLHQHDLPSKEFDEMTVSLLQAARSLIFFRDVEYIHTCVPSGQRDVHFPAVCGETTLKRAKVGSFLENPRRFLQ